MNEFLSVITESVAVLISALSYLILARAILQIFASEESVALQFCYVVTEPVISPVRNALSRVESLQGLPLDFSFMATFMLLSIIKMSLPRI